jgi:hypothetical protein
VVHFPAGESIGIGMAVLTRQQSGKVTHWLAHNTQGLSIVAGRTSAGYADMYKALDQKARGADMAGVARAGCLNMVDGLRGGANATPDGVASGAILGRVLENAIHMALFAP